MRSKRVIVLTLDSALDKYAFRDFVDELDSLVEQMVCEYAAACRDDVYAHEIFVSKRTIWGKEKREQ